MSLKYEPSSELLHISAYLKRVVPVGGEAREQAADVPLVLGFEV